MDTHEKTKEQLIIELQELQQANNSLKVSYGKDITMCKQAEEALRASDALLQSAISILPVGLWVFNAEGKIVISSAAAQQIWAGVRYLGVDQLGEYKGWRTDSGKLIEAHEWAGARALMKGETSIEEEVEIECFDGTHKIILDTAVPLFKSDGSIDGAITINQDITERKRANLKLEEQNKELAFQIYEHNQAEVALKKSEERFRSVFENSTIGIYRTTPEGQILLVNPTLVKLLGYSSFEELACRNLKENGFEPSYERTFFMDILKREGEVKGLESAWTKMNGTTLFVSESARAISDNEGKIIYYDGIVEDITLRKQTEEMLRKSELMLQTVLDNFPGVVFWKDRQSNYLGCNQSLATRIGLKNPAEIVGKTDFEMPWTSTEAINYRKDDIAVMESGKERLHIIEKLRQSDGQVKWIDTSKLPLRDSSGQVIGVIGVSNDISTLKIAEQKLINTNKELALQNREKEKRADELIIANKELLFQNEEKEKRAAELVIAKDKAEASDRLKTAFMNNISHEISTPLNGILGFAPFIIQPDITMEEKEEFLEILNFSSIRLMNTITDIMDMSLIISGNMEVHPQPIDISSLLTNVFEHFQKPSEKKYLGLKMQFPDNADQFILITDGEMLRKAVSKLVDNSVKFTKEGSITLGFELINNEVEIFVKDTGEGIEKDAQELIFKYFMQENVSKTRRHEGSGLGLSIVKGMIQLLGGEIRLESTKNVGTTVFLTLPNITSTAS